MKRLLVFAVMVLSAPSVTHAQTQWDHNGSVMMLYANGASRQFIYSSPRAGLPVSSGTLLFKGTRSGNAYSGTAYVFSSQCGSRAYSVSGSVSADDRSVTLYGKAPLVDSDCRVADYRDDVLVFNLIEPEAPVQEAVAQPQSSGTPTLVCRIAEFTEERRLRSQIDGNRATTMWVAQAINYLRDKYCVVLAEAPAAANQTWFGDGCGQASGYYLGELVYWGECHE